MKQTRFNPGDLIIYRKTKHSTCPGPRASNIQPAQRGDVYNYTVDKFWIVQAVNEDGTLILETRRGKTHLLRSDDPLLKRANFWERLIYRHRFHAVLQRKRKRSEELVGS